ncbi:MAG: serine/threonine protein kinase [Vicinamibacteria bacterium]|nr:serine/threonine protein kinase [Vicinamibacteria bacterium]
MPPAQWKAGDVLAGTYEVRGVLGEGGQGRVFRVRHLHWDRDVALKVPRSELLAPPLDELVREAQLWVDLPAHPNVVTCHYLRAVDGVPGLFVECVDGGSLGARLADGRLHAGGPGPALARILDCAIQLAWGLHHAHAHGLVHRDVKPGNVLIGEAGEVKVTDFGLARLGRTTPRAETSPGLTPAYASPEQIRGGSRSPASDAWSWAVTVLRTFALAATWKQGPHAPAALDELCARGPEPGRPAMPGAVAALLRRCFVVEPDRRASDLLAIAAELQSAWSELVGGAYPVLAPSTAPTAASQLNDGALTLLDLGHPADAEAAWARALIADPSHPEAAYNLGLRRWRRAEIADEVLLGDLEASFGGGRSRAGLLLAHVHLERGDPGTASAYLRDAERRTPDDPAVTSAHRALARARSGDAPQRGAWTAPGLHTRVHRTTVGPMLEPRAADGHADCRTMDHTYAAREAARRATAEAEALCSPRVAVEHLLIGICAVLAESTPARLAALAPHERDEFVELAAGLATLRFDPARGAATLRRYCREQVTPGLDAWQVVGRELDVWADPQVTLAALWHEAIKAAGGARPALEEQGPDLSRLAFALALRSGRAEAR